MKLVMYSVLCSMLLFSCQKEAGTAADLAPQGVAVFSAAGSPGACTVATVVGYFATGTALSPANKVSVQVNVTKIGTYAISTATVNGYKFSATGSFTATGVQTVTLTATGTPLAAQTDSFTAGSGGCTFNVVVVAPAPAVYTLSGAPAACTGANVAGSYIVGTALAASNTATIKVNVTSLGTFTLSTNTVGGMTFSKTGVFNTTGLQDVILVGTGTPTVGGANTLTPQIGTSSCTFIVNVVGPATYTLSGAPGACTVATVAGTYGVGTPVTAANTVTVQANVTVAGAYTITTNTVGGLTFSKTGIFTATGNQPVVLNASGTPTTAGSNTFTVGTGGCTFSVPVVGPATYTFPGSPGTCTVATVAGSYVKGTPLGATHTVTVQVNVTTIGSFNISTNTVAGMTFSKSGVFTVTGVQTVVLNGAGNPSTAGTHTFTVGTGGCTFEVIATNPPAGAGIYNCKIDGVYTSFTDRAEVRTLDDFWSPPKPYFYANGYTGPPNGDVVPQFQIFIEKNDETAIGTGTYNENGIITPGYRIEIDYTLQNPDLSTTIWNTSSTLFPPPNPPFTIIITSVTATRIKGTFSGKLTNTLQGGTLFKTITEGNFDLPIVN